MDHWQTTRSASLRERLSKNCDKLIFWVATFWGVCVVLPVGLQYLCLLLLLILMPAAGRHHAALQFLRQERFWASAVIAFLGITLLTLVVQDKYYRETPSNLLHGIRIVLTLLVGLSLRRSEAVSALLSAAFALCLMSILIALNHFGLAPSISQALGNFIPDGNKWIGLSIFLVILMIACIRLPRVSTRWLKYWPLFIAGFALLMNLWVMNQRTAFGAMIIGLLCLIFAQWRNRRNPLIFGLLATIALSFALVQNVAPLRAKLINGLQEIEAAQNGMIDERSMSIRYQMYTQTTYMILERPWQGWGIGGWNEQWKARTKPLLHASNMPHNDFLWMGAQSGWPGAFAWLILMLSLCWLGWKQQNPMGNIAFSAAAIALISSLFNSATRDASIGLPMLFVVAACIAVAKSSHESPSASFRMN